MATIRTFAPDLPQEALVRILQQVEQRERLTACAFVCTSWAAAAGAATTDVAITEDHVFEETIDGLNRWLQQHPGQVESITVAGNSDSDPIVHPLQLPCSLLTRLQALDLNSCTLKLLGPADAAGGRPGPLMLPALQYLSLSKVFIRPASLASLQLPQLTSLALEQSPYGCWSWGKRAEDALAAVLRRLPQLLELRLSGLRVGNAALETLSELQHLQGCSIKGCNDVTPEVLSGLISTSLTALTFAPSYPTGGTGLMIDDVPAAGWPQLQLLAVYHTPMQPALLNRLPALQVLDLWNCALMPTEPAEAAEEVHGMEEEAAGASELLAALAQLTQLRRLELFEIDLRSLGVLGRLNLNYDNWPLHFTYLQPFSSLVASDQLESLVLTYRHDEPPKVVQPLPRHCMEQIFGNGRQLLNLTELVFDALCPEVLESFIEYVQYGESEDSEDDPDNWQAREERDPWYECWCFDQFDLSRVRAACPNLRRLTLNSVLPTEACEKVGVTQLRKLKELSGLTHLCIGGPWIVNHTAAALAELTRLRSLKICNTPYLRAAGLGLLTALRRLRRLEAVGVGFLRGVNFELESQAQKPDVWRQLSRQVRRIRAEQEEAGAEDREVQSDDSMLQDSDHGW